MKKISADNGIYVLFTDSEKGPEYRVTYSNAIDNIYGKFNAEIGKYEGDIQSIKETFGKVPVFYTLNEALDFAEELENNMDPTEDGICVISDFQFLGYVFD